jgi:hypothetical protein
VLLMEVESFSKAYSGDMTDSDTDAELFDGRTRKRREEGHWADSDWESGDERPKKVRMGGRLVRCEGRCMRLVAWRYSYGDKLDAMLAALWRVVSVRDLHLRERALSLALRDLREMVYEVREDRKLGGNMCPSRDRDGEYWLFKRQLRQVEKWCCDGRYVEDASEEVLRYQLGVLEGWMREVGVVDGPWQHDKGTTCRRSARLTGKRRVNYKVARSWKRRGNGK